MSSKTQIIPNSLSFESLKKLNQYGIEYWSARDLQAYLGYSEWRKFESTVKKAIESSKQSGNDPRNHFVGADKMVQIGNTLPENILPAEPINDVAKRLSLKRFKFGY